MYLIRHSERLDKVDINKWINSDRHKINSLDIPISENGLKIANDKIKNILLNVLKDDLGFIYSSPFTRCIQTSLEFQRFILNKYKVLIPIKIEYGLTFEYSYDMDLYVDPPKFIIKKNKVKYINKNIKIIDNYLKNKNIFKRFGDKLFDIKYKSIISIDEINNPTSLINTMNNRFSAILNISKQINFNKINIICTHGDNMTFIKSFVEETWNQKKKFFIIQRCLLLLYENK